MEVERMKRVAALIVSPVHRIVAVPHLETRRETGHVWKVLAPVDAKCIAVAMGHVIGEARNSVVAFAVVSLGIADRTGKAAATEDVSGNVNAAGIGNGLEVGIGPRLV